MERDERQYSWWPGVMKDIGKYVSSSQIVDLVSLYFIFHFYFHSVLLFYFLFLKQLGLGLTGHAVTLVTT